MEQPSTVSYRVFTPVCLHQPVSRAGGADRRPSGHGASYGGVSVPEGVPVRAGDGQIFLFRGAIFNGCRTLSSALTPASRRAGGGGGIVGPRQACQGQVSKEGLEWLTYSAVSRRVGEVAF